MFCTSSTELFSVVALRAYKITVLNMHRLPLAEAISSLQTPGNPSAAAAFETSRISRYSRIQRRQLATQQCLNLLIQSKT